MSSTTPPGWYPDPWGQSPQRFWDGAQWTPHISPGAEPLRSGLPEDAPIYGPSIWLLALLPLLSAVTIWFIRIDTSALADYVKATQRMQAGETTPPPVLNPFSIYGPGYAVAMLVGLLLYATLVVLAYRDHQHLTHIGVPRPFHWAWAFLGAIVYVIGRSAVVRKVATPRGLAPMWAAIAVGGIALVSSAIWIATFVGSMAQQLPPTVG